MKHMRILALLLAGVLLAGCADAGAPLLGDESRASLIKEQRQAVPFTGDELQEAYDTSAAVSIRFKDQTVEIEGEGAVFAEGAVVIQSPGTYVLCGQGDEAGIIVDCVTDEAVRIVLNGVILNRSAGPVLTVNKGSEVILTALPGTANRLRCCAKDEDNTSAAITSETDLVINGGGSLEIRSDNGEGILAGRNVKMLNVMVCVQAETDGIHAADLIGGLDCILNVRAKQTGLWAGNETETGQIIFSDGVLTVNADGAALFTDGDIKTSGSELNISEGTQP